MKRFVTVLVLSLTISTLFALIVKQTAWEIVGNRYDTSPTINFFMAVDLEFFLITLFSMIPAFIAINRKYFPGILIITTISTPLYWWYALSAMDYNGNLMSLGIAFGISIIALIWAVSSPKNTKEEEGWINTCDKCGFKKTFNQPLKLYKCPQCGHENVNV